MTRIVGAVANGGVRTATGLAVLPEYRQGTGKIKLYVAATGAETAIADQSTTTCSVVVLGF